MKKLITLNILFLFFTINSYAQLDSIFDQGVYRTFILHLPSGYNSNHQYPIVINFHGLNSNAAQEQSYTQFDIVADTFGFIVIYPNGIDGKWKVADRSDVDFIYHLIGTVRSRYSCNSSLFVTGISDGGFMTYKLAINLPLRLTAIAVIAGNMAKTLQDNSPIDYGFPVMHFHGTDDSYVNYDGVPPFIPSVDTTIHWWVEQNKCNPNPTITNVPDINTSDNCTVEKYYYGGGTNGSEVLFYKIIGGGHTWPGSIPVPIFGKTNQDINASSLIGSFFHQFSSSTDIKNHVDTSVLMSIYPNPASDYLIISGFEGEVEIINALGISNWNGTVKPGQRIDVSNFGNGIYFLKFNNSVKKFLIMI